MKTINEAWSTLKDPASRHDYDVDNGLLDDHGVPVEDGPGVGWQRPVADDECELCGSAPALPLVLRQETGKILWRTRRRMEGTFCRDCGLALFRSNQNRTLITGWWGVLSFFVNIGSVLANTAAWAKVRRLDSPRRDPAVVSYLEAPLEVGSPLYRRAGVWFAAVLMFFGASAAAAEGNQDSYTPTSYSSGSSSSGYTPSYGTTSGGSSSYTTSDTWTAADKAQLRSAGTRAGLSYTEADCIVRYLTSRYSPSQRISDTAFEMAGNYCL